jgi:hypothetical protein
MLDAATRALSGFISSCELAIAVIICRITGDTFWYGLDPQAPLPEGAEGAAGRSREAALPGGAEGAAGRSRRRRRRREQEPRDGGRRCGRRASRLIGNGSGEATRAREMKRDQLDFSLISDNYE